MADLSNSSNSLGTNPNDHLARLLVDDIEDPWYKSFWQNVKDAINPPKLPPLELTSQPVTVKDIWGLYGRQKKSFVMSTGFQVVVVLAALWIFSIPAVQKTMQKGVAVFLPDLSPAPEMKIDKGGGGGGNRSPLPASKGALPKVAPRQFTPPSAVVQNLNPKLVMDPTIIAQPDAKLPQIDSPNYGDPLSKFGVLSNGTGSGGGIGSGSGGGVGPGHGAGFGPGSGGNAGGGVYRIGGGVSQPVPIYRPDPDYSEEARKAKYQGTVILAIVVDEKGNPRDVRVVKPLGLGLDQKAIEAVEKWRFRPGMKDGHPVKVMAQIEVNFRLL